MTLLCRRQAHHRRRFRGHQKEVGQGEAHQTIPLQPTFEYFPRAFGWKRDLKSAFNICAVDGDLDGIQQLECMEEHGEDK